MSQDIQTEIDAEMARAVAKFPLWPTDMYHAFAIVGEEIGEVFKDIVQYHYEPHKNKSIETIRMECVQSMCMLMRFVAALDSGHYQMPACTQAPQSMQPRLPTDDDNAHQMTADALAAATVAGFVGMTPAEVIWKLARESGRVPTGASAPIKPNDDEAWSKVPRVYRPD